MNDNYLKRRVLIIVIIVIIIILLGYFLISYYNDLKSDTREIIKKNDEPIALKKEEKKDNNIRVDIKGEVKSPNIYDASSDERVIDIINKAGGLTKNADTSIINLSKKLQDEMVIIIYSKKQVKSYEETLKNKEELLGICNDKVANDACISDKDINNKSIKNNDSNNTNLVNINTATLDELQTLPRIGENKAKSIISYREKNNGFKSIEEIKNVTGIGDSIFDQIKENITI